MADGSPSSKTPTDCPWNCTSKREIPADNALQTLLWNQRILIALGNKAAHQIEIGKT